MSNWIVFSFVTAFVITFVLTPLVKKLAFKAGAIDVPKDGRRMHKKPTALWGGLAIFMGFFISTVFYAELSLEIKGILAGACIMVVLGMVDDKKPLNAKFKFFVQIIAALIPAMCGVTIDHIAVPTFIVESGMLRLGWLAIPITVLWIVGITNALNLMDGLDGLAAGVATIASLAMLYISVVVSDSNVTLILAALVGACFGFLPYNFNPAKLFMGDTGALMLGFLLASLSVQGLFKGYAVISFGVPLLILGLPIFDTGAAIFRRIKNKQPIMSPDRAHLHHRLVDSGLSQKQAVVVIYTVCTVLCLFAVLLVSTGAISALALSVIIIAFLVFIGITPYLSDLLSDGDHKDEDDTSSQK